MPRKTVKHAEISAGIQYALDTAPDYSNAFTQEVMSLSHVISRALAAHVEHDDDMNYSSAQKLVVWLEKDCHLTTPRNPKAAYRLIDFISSRGRLFTFVTLQLSPSTSGWREKGLEEPRKYWSVVSQENLPAEIISVQNRLASIMEAKNYAFVDESVFAQEAPGHWTKLDGQPANIFQVLFSEMY